MILLNKWDLVRDEARRREIAQQLARRLGFVPDALVLHVSARTGEGTAQILPAALTLLEELRGEVTTSQVNRVLREALERNAPPLRGKRVPRLYYATCISTRPFTVLIFVNDPELIPRNYRRYLEASFRRAFASEVDAAFADAVPPCLSQAR